MAMEMASNEREQVNVVLLLCGCKKFRIDSLANRIDIVLEAGGHSDNR